jgi:gamma-glutamyl hercynylcysteine S-oxide synthase
MELDKNIIHKRLINKNFKVNKQDLITILNSTFYFTRNIIRNYDFTKQNNSDKHNMNPLMWEYGHFLFFWEYLIIRNLDFKHDYIPKLKKEYYDSFLLSKNNRYYYMDKLVKPDELYKIMSNIQNLMLNVIESNLNTINMYLIYLGCSHQHMHNESFLYTMNQLDINFEYSNNDNYKEPIYDNIEMIQIKGGDYIQGVDNNTNYFYFDNESPKFQVKVDNFKTSKHPITNYQFLQFVKDGCYGMKELFSPEGYRYIESNNVMMPASWVYKDGEFYEKLFGRLIELRYNHPVSVTWYEATAFCKFYGYRMLKEKEWEYMAISNKYSNCDYNYPQSVLQEKNENMGVYGLYGNYWEWCEDPIYPYDGFTIDPVYREMSYPFFGFKKICRGGAWCVPKFLATRTYRNSQMPDCYYQFISFRVCK